MSRIHRLAAVLAALLTAACAPAVAHGASNTTFSGNATVVKGNVLGVPLNLVATGEVPAGGGALHQSGVCYPAGSNCVVGIPDLTTNQVQLEVLHAAVVAHGDRSRAEASAARFTIAIPGAPTLSGEFLAARATASCSNGVASVSGEAEIADLTVNGIPVVASGDKNQSVAIPLGTLTLNEQAEFVIPDRGITVNALHLVVPGVADLIVGQATADIACGLLAQCPGSHLFVTGGGWITGVDGSKQHFTVAGRNGQYWGHVMWSPTKLHVKDPYALAFYPGPTSVGNVLDDLNLNHAEFANAISLLGTLSPGTKVQGGAILAWDSFDPVTHANQGIAGGALALDLGEPGKLPQGHDVFELVSVGQNVGAGAGFLQGGNIQMHGKCGL